MSDEIPLNVTPIFEGLKVVNAVKPNFAPKLVTPDVAKVTRLYEPDVPHPVLILHGEACRFMGKSTDYGLIYESVNGRRYRLVDNGRTYGEPLTVNSKDEFIPFEQRGKLFSTLDEEARHTALLGNTVSLEDYKKKNSQPVNKQLREHGIDQQLFMDAVIAQGRLEHMTALNYSELQIRHAENEAAKAKKQLDDQMAGLGLGIHHESFNEMVDDFKGKMNHHSEIEAAKKIIDNVDEYLSGANDYELAKQLPTFEHFSLKLINPAFIHRAIEAADRVGLKKNAAVIIGKTYGSIGMRQTAEDLWEKHEASDDEVNGYRNFIDKFTRKARAALEIPAVIAALKAEDEADSGPSPIPARFRADQILALQLEHAAATVNIGELPMTEDDIKAYRLEADPDLARQRIMDKFDISYFSAQLYEERLDAAIKEIVLKEFRQSDVFISGRKVADLITEKLGEDRIIEIGDDFNSYAVKFYTGAGYVAVSRPMEDPAQRGEGKTMVTLRYESKERFINGHSTHALFDATPTPQQVVDRALAYAALHDTKLDVKAGAEFGKHFDKLEDDRYNLTVINKHIRQAIGDLKKQGVLPKELKTSVKKHSGSITLKVTDLPDGFRMYTNEYIAYLNSIDRTASHVDYPSRPDQTYTKEGATLLTILENIRSAWNYRITDRNVNYYGSTLVDSCIDEREKEHYIFDSNYYDEQYSNQFDSLPIPCRRHAWELLEDGFTNTPAGKTIMLDRIDTGEYQLAIKGDDPASVSLVPINEAYDESKATGEVFCVATAAKAAGNAVMVYGLSDELTCIQRDDEANANPPHYDGLTQPQSLALHRLTANLEKIGMEAKAYIPTNEPNRVLGYAVNNDGQERWFSFDQEGIGGLLPVNMADSLNDIIQSSEAYQEIDLLGRSKELSLGVN